MSTSHPHKLGNSAGSAVVHVADLRGELATPSSLRLHAIRMIFSGVVILIGVSVLVGWAIGNKLLKSMLPGMVTMKVNTALCLVLLGVSLTSLIRVGRHWGCVVWICLAVVSLLAVLTLAEYAFGVNLRIDNFIFQDRERLRFPGRSAPATNIAFIGLVIAFAMLHIRKAELIAQGILLVALSAPLATLGGYLYGAPGLFVNAQYPVIALHTSLALMFLCIGGLFARSEDALMGVVTSDTIAGSLARKLLPAAVGVPLLAGLLVLAGERARLYTPFFGSALLVSFCALFFAGVVCWTVTVLWKTEAARRSVEQVSLRTERKLGEGEQRLEIALETAGLGLWQLDMTTDVLDCSIQTRAHFGLGPDDPFTRQSMVAAIHPDDRQRTVTARVDAFTESRDYHAEYRVIWPDGSLHWIVASGRGIEMDGDRPRMVGVTLDITAKKNVDAERERLLQGEREARGEAERADRMKDEFLSVVSHELRTPLNAILGWSQILRLSSSAEDLSEGLASIERNARAQVRIIEDILDMSRIISGTIRLDLQPMNVESVIHAALDSMRLAAAAKKIRLETTLDPQAQSMAGDPIRIQQVVWNLLSNAIKFTPSGGTVNVSAKQADNRFEITVADSGEGIRPDFLPHVFDRFRQADGSTTRRHGGLGLGLAIVKQLVELHAGTVTAHSPGPGQGATFCVSLPLKSAISAEPPPLDPALALPISSELLSEVPSLDGLRVLIVDDEHDLRMLVKKILESAAASTTIAASVDEAMIRFSDGRDFDLIISDIGMPGRDGYDFIRSIRSLPTDRGKTIPVIALTAFARTEDRNRALAAGFNLHLAKPVDAGELCTIVAKLASAAA